MKALDAILYLLSNKDTNGPSCIEKIVQYINYGDNVMDKVKEIAESYTNNFHPILIVANLEGKPYRYYACVFDIIYTFQSFTSAFDIIFKSFFVFNVKYPSDATLFYIFIQQFLYGIYLKRDSKKSVLIKLFHSLDCNRLASSNNSM